MFLTRYIDQSNFQFQQVKRLVRSDHTHVYNNLFSNLPFGRDNGGAFLAHANII
jgi:hypothetical protein